MTKGLISVQKKEIGKLKKGDRFKLSARGGEEVYTVVHSMHGRPEMMFMNDKETFSIPKSGKDELVTIVTD